MTARLRPQLGQTLLQFGVEPPSLAPCRLAGGSMCRDTEAELSNVRVRILRTCRESVPVRGQAGVLSESWWRARWSGSPATAVR
jgi:hypothetical protein